jgi:hypothetical protein
MPETNSPIAVSSEKQLFIDNRFIAREEGITLAMNPPRQTYEPLLVVDRPWEGRIGEYNTVLKEGDLFRMWYHVFPPDRASGITEGVAYAESDDGIHWTKPDLGLIEYQGSTANNLVAPQPVGSESYWFAGGRRLDLRMQGAMVFSDTNPSCPPAERYKLWSKMQGIVPVGVELDPGEVPIGTREGDALESVQRLMSSGLVSMYSEDGIRWNVYEKEVDTAACDTENVAIWDERLQKYVGYVRMIPDVDGVKYRSVGRLESDDFQNWSETESVLEADQIDLRVPVPRRMSTYLNDPSSDLRAVSRPVDVYTNGFMKYPYAQDAYFMMPSYFYHWSLTGPNTLDVRLLTSRDGIEWRSAGGRDPFLRLGQWGGLSSGQIYACPGVARVGDELWSYYAGYNTDHSWIPDPLSDVEVTGIFRAVSRLDGFISADAPYQGGALVTPPIVFTGKKLELNLDTSAGGVVRVEVQSADGKPLDGYTLADADDLNGNSVRMPVRFNGDSDMGRLAGTPIRLSFQMYDCKLYAFQFVS